jgi:pimeloyl-ACP methyl ester carboxylesterase
MITANQYAHLKSGIKLHYASAGDSSKPLLLMLHGFPEFWFAWEPLMPEFARDYYVVAPDQRGYNLSSKPHAIGDYKPKYLVEDLIQLIDFLGKKEAIVVAHDWGGAIAWNLAILYPHLVKKLIILNSPHPFLFAKALSEDKDQQESSQYMNWLREPASEDALTKNNFELLENMLTRFGDSEWFTQEVKDRYHEAWQQPRAVQSSVNWYRASPLYPPKGDDPGASKLSFNAKDFMVKVPTLVLWGDADIALKPILLKGLEEFLLDGKMTLIPGASHWLIHERPKLITQEIKKFLGAN